MRQGENHQKPGVEWEEVRNKKRGIKNRIYGQAHADSSISEGNFLST